LSTLAQYWTIYERNVLRDADERKRAALRLSFYAGAATALRLLSDGELPDTDIGTYLESLMQECRDQLPIGSDHGH
jgi:hypothetical protein